MRSLSLAAVLLAGCSAARPAPEPGPAEPPAPLRSSEGEVVERLERARSLGEGQLEALTRAASPGVRSRALLALARIQAPSTLGAVLAALDDPEPGVRQAAAFAAGQLGLSWEPIPEARRALAEQRLLERLPLEEDPSAKRALVEALGKIGGERSLPTLERLLNERESVERAAIALGLLAKRDPPVTSPTAVHPLELAIRFEDEGVRFAACWALMRYRSPEGRDGLRRCLADPRPLVRANGARGLAEVARDEDLEALAAAVSDPDERVAAEAARGLARRAAACPDGGSCPALRALSGTGDWGPAVVWAVAGEPLHSKAAAGLFAQRAERLAPLAGEEPLAASTRGRMHCMLALAHDRALASLSRTRDCGHSAVDESWRRQLQARALGEARGAQSARAQALARLASDEEPRVRAAAARALSGLAAAEPARSALARLLADPDPGVAGAAAEAVVEGRHEGFSEGLLRLLGKPWERDGALALEPALAAVAVLGIQAAEPQARALTASSDPSVREAAARAVEKLTGQRPDLPGWAPGPWAAEPIPERPFVTVTTSRGPLRIRLFATDAPDATRNFVHLVRRGFYRGLAFHRVVPAFVAQGGDPRGDGSGGPGWSIRCEASPRPYQVGTVGMALSGKDTGGSQFFVTTTPQPHLDGRYTAFGEVVEGMDVVRALVEGDQILEARVDGDDDQIRTTRPSDG